jgi:hypothetical protein
MKLKLIIPILFIHISIFGQSYDTYKYASIEIDSNLQLQKQDTLNIVKAKIKGTWQYYGKFLNDKIIDDTIASSSQGHEVVKQGNVYLINKAGETNLYKQDVSNFDFENEDIFQNIMHTIVFCSEKGEFGIAYEVKSCPSFYHLVYYDNQVGILVNFHIFEPILKLEDKILQIQTYSSEIEHYVKR